MWALLTLIAAALVAPKSGSSSASSSTADSSKTSSTRSPATGGRSAPAQTMASFGTGGRTAPGLETVSIKVLQPKARISWDKDKWEGTRLEDYFDNGEVLGFDLANDVLSFGVPDMDGSAGGGCWATVTKGGWLLDLPYVVYIIPASKAASVLALPVATSTVAAAINATLKAVAVTSLLLEDKDWRSGGDWRSSVTRSVSLAPGSYVAVAKLQTPQTKKWCVPMKWWEWTQHGPRANKSVGYMREHCTSHLTKFKRSVSTARVADYSKTFTVGDGRQTVELAPVASLSVGARTHFETDYTKYFVYPACVVTDWLFDMIVKKIKGD